MALTWIERMLDERMGDEIFPSIERMSEEVKKGWKGKLVKRVHPDRHN